MNSASSQRGMTLLEVMVGLFILSIILGVIYSSFFSAAKASKLLESNEDVYQTARSLFDMISLELRDLYYYGGPQDQTGFGLKGIDGEADGQPADAIHFLTTAHRRKGKNVREGRMAEVGYFFHIDPLSNEKRLIKSLDPAVDLDFYKGANYIFLTDDIEAMEITYYNMKNDEWLNAWDTETQKVLPDRIRIELAVRVDEDTSSRFQTVIQPVLRR